ncbi:NADH-quinone oxidoreductase subunit B [Spirochaeta isovalerica]|uniref:NADH-quinone oxidoreductase subunit B n=1 Tax=Spirochaeta isovalerica TaxID=150 RepID=A0A841RGY0_9SPIO|nr:NADH-quinone oxidoreductase subunit NuoB [Spirochaeta isovalerica]MBB6481768.1 NADH-quinone oxidoreductase subunit B [Spirochaeta isovalerica]
MEKFKDFKKRTVIAPDGEKIEIDPMKDYYCDAIPTPRKDYDKIPGILENFKNWARSESLWILAYGSGCGAIEMRPLMTPKHDAYRYGIQWRPTPRQANLLMISGYLSVKTLRIVVRAYEQMPSPKYVMGLGSCTINGGMYWDSYNTINRLDHFMPVDTYVTGCMPRPEALIAGFDELKKIIRAGKGVGADKYAENFAWYKENQKKILGDVGLPEYSW